MKVFIKTMWLVFFISPVLCFGQTISNADELAKVEALAEQLELSTEQTANFTTVLKQRGTECVQAMGQHKDDLAGLRKSIKKIQLAQDEEVKLLLSDAQFEMYQVEIKKARVERRRQYLQESRANKE